jgi:hypothetical protein
MNETAYPLPPPGMFVATIAMIHSGKYFHPGEPMPLSELSKIPPNLRKKRFLKFHDPHVSIPNGGDAPRNLIYETNTQYSVSPEGDRHHQREVAGKINLEAMRIEAEQQLEEQIKYEIEHPDEQTAKALAIAEEDYRMSIQGQIASQSYLAKEREAADQQAKALAEEDQIDVTQNLVTPTIEEVEEWTPTPATKPVVRKMRKRFVNRNGTWLRVKRLKHFHVGEKVYVKNADQKFQVIGQVNKNGKPPACYLEDKI